MQSRQILIYKTSDVALNDWRECVLKKLGSEKGSLACWIEKPDADGGTLIVHWSPGVGTATLRHVRISLDGGTDLHGKSVVAFDTIEGERILIIKRPPTNKAVRGTVEGKAGILGDFESTFYLPPVPLDDRPANHSIPTLVEIPAKNFNRSLHIEVGVLPYGSDVIHNAPPYGHAENMVEYDFYIHSGRYDFQIEYAAGEPRPVEVTLTQKGEVVFSIVALTEITGGWSMPQQQYRSQLIVEYPRGQARFDCIVMTTFHIYGRCASIPSGLPNSTDANRLEIAARGLSSSGKALSKNQADRVKSRIERIPVRRTTRYNVA
jgi:hypothetical protein